MLSGVSLLAVSKVNNPVGLVGLPYVMRSAHFFVAHIQTEKRSSWNGPTVHVCCFMLARASTKTFVSRIHIRQHSSPKKQRKKIFVSRKIRYAGSLVSRSITVRGFVILECKTVCVKTVRSCSVVSTWNIRNAPLHELAILPCVQYVHVSDSLLVQQDYESRPVILKENHKVTGKTGKQSDNQGTSIALC